MASKFVGGPLDGQLFDLEQINAIASLAPMFTETGNRLFALMPPLEECHRILRGEVSKDSVQGAWNSYERVFLPSGEYEWRDASGSLREVLDEANRPLSEEAKARRQAFGEYADRFIEQLKNTKIDATTEISLIYQYVDPLGNSLKSGHTSITSGAIVRHKGDPEFARQFAIDAHLDGIIANVESMVRGAPTGFTTFHEIPNLSVQIMGFELVIEDV